MPNTDGHIYYIQHNSDLDKPWRLYCFNQISNKKMLVYSGKRAIQSVTGDASCKTIIFSMREKVSSNSDYEIFKLSGSLSRLTNNNANDIDVSQSADSNTVVWQGLKQGKKAIYYRIYSGNSSTQKVMVHAQPQYDPSVSGDGRSVALIRKLADGKEKILQYRIANKTYKGIYTSTNDLRHPSSSDDGNRFVWLEHTNSKYLVKIKDLSKKTTTILIKNGFIKHPHLASNGQLFNLWDKKRWQFRCFSKEC